MLKLRRRILFYFQRRINVISTLIYNVETTLIWGWNVGLDISLFNIHIYIYIYIHYTCTIYTIHCIYNCDIIVYTVYSIYNCDIIVYEYTTWIVGCSYTIVLGNQRFPVRVRLLAMCRGELSAVIARLMSNCLWSGWKW